MSNQERGRARKELKVIIFIEKNNHGQNFLYPIGKLPVQVHHHSQVEVQHQGLIGLPEGRIQWV